MSTFTWRGTQLKLSSYRLKVGEQQLELRRCYGDKPGTPVFMVAGFGSDGSLFSPNTEGAGLSPYLASKGFDVYVADLRGKGASWPKVTRHSNWGAHEIITEDIPTCLNYIDRLRPGEPQVWVSHGMAAPMLMATYARYFRHLTTLIGAVHFAPFRRCDLDHLPKSVRYSLWQGFLSSQVISTGVAGIDQHRQESKGVYSDILNWHSDPNWLDPVDGYDYRAALMHSPLPPALYFALQEPKLPLLNLWGGVSDARNWLAELGPHDARLVALGKRAGNECDYGFTSMLTDRQACDDHFVTLVEWLTDQTQQSTLNMENKKFA